MRVNQILNLDMRDDYDREAGHCYVSTVGELYVVGQGITQEGPQKVVVIHQEGDLVVVTPYNNTSTLEDLMVRHYDKFEKLKEAIDLLVDPRANFKNRKEREVLKKGCKDLMKAVYREFSNAPFYSATMKEGFEKTYQKLENKLKETSVEARL